MGYRRVWIVSRKLKGGTSYDIRWWQNGKCMRLSVGRSKTKAERARVAKEYEINNTSLKRNNVQSKSPIFMPKFIENLTEIVKPQISTNYWDSIILALDHLGEVLKNRDLGNLTPQDVDMYKNIRLKSVAVATLNKELRHLKAVFNRAVKLRWISSNPFIDVSYIKSDQRQINIVTHKQQEQLLFSASLKMRCVILLAIEAGMRRNEIKHLRRESINLETGQIEICGYQIGDIHFRTKSRSNRIVYIFKRSLIHIKAHFDETDDLLPFWYEDASSITRAFNRLKKPLDIAARFHDLRATCATRMAESGVDAMTLQKYMGHHDIKVTEQYYLRISDNALSRARDITENNSE